MHYPRFVWGIEREQRDVDLEGLAFRRLHLIGAEHHARGRFERRAALVFKTLARAENRLLTHDAGAAHFDRAAVGVDDAPIAGAQLHSIVTAIFDHHGVGPEEVAVVRSRLVGQERRLDRNGNLTRDTPVHGASLRTNAGRFVNDRTRLYLVHNTPYSCSTVTSDFTERAMKQFS